MTVTRLESVTFRWPCTLRKLKPLLFLPGVKPRSWRASCCCCCCCCCCWWWWFWGCCVFETSFGASCGLFFVKVVIITFALLAKCNFSFVVITLDTFGSLQVLKRLFSSFTKRGFTSLVQNDQVCISRLTKPSNFWKSHCRRKKRPHLTSPSDRDVFILSSQQLSTTWEKKQISIFPALSKVKYLIRDPFLLAKRTTHFCWLLRQK